MTAQAARIERVALAIFRSTFHPRDAANETLIKECRKAWPVDWQRAERAARAAIDELTQEKERICPRT